MNNVLRFLWPAMAASGFALTTPTDAHPTPVDPLPSWIDGAPKRAIIDFVTRVTTQGGTDFVSPAERIATIDNDGTLWCEQPAYFQAFFAFGRVKELAAKNPALKNKEPYRAILENDQASMANFTEHDLAALVAATHSGMTTVEFDHLVRAWLDSAHHPRYHKLVKECVYLPQIELLAYLKANDFKTFIVSGGGIEFIRGFAEETYGIPPERVISNT